MSYEDRANARPNLNDESDVEEEALVNDYREQVNFDDSMSELDRTTSLGGSQAQDLQAQLAAAATPLEYQATLETKFASYDNYCSLFHYILNSEGPVDLEVPSVGVRCGPFDLRSSNKEIEDRGSDIVNNQEFHADHRSLSILYSTTGPGMSLTSSSTNSSRSAATATGSLAPDPTRRRLNCSVRTPTHGAATPF